MSTEQQGCGRKSDTLGGACQSPIVLTPYWQEEFNRCYSQENSKWACSRDDNRGVVDG